VALLRLIQIAPDSSSQSVFRGTYTGSGEGIVLLGGGILVAGAGGAVLNFPPNLFQWVGGTIDATTAPVTNRGTITIPAFVTQPYLSGTLNNAGTIISAGAATLFFEGKGSLTNLPD